MRRSRGLLPAGWGLMLAAFMPISSLADVPQSGFAPNLQEIGIRDIQRQLRAQGYDPGPDNGAMNQTTRGAILAYQHDYGLREDGVASPGLENMLHFLRRHAPPSPPFTILITGGGSGIGRALAEAFHALGNQVVIAGRRQQVLQETIIANPGMKSAVFDIENTDAIRTFGAQLAKDYPGLNAVIHNAGIMRPEDLKSGGVADAESIIAINLLGPMRLTAALLPHLLKQPRATVMTVSSGLGLVPMAMTPTYCATKAAIHSYSQSLRYQLKGSSVQVLELIPPYVQTQLMGDRQANDPNAMPLQDFITETMNILKTSPDATEICVERVKPLRFAERNDGYDAFFTRFNDAVAAASH